MSKNHPNGNLISLDVETADRLLKEVVPSQEMQDYLKKIGHRFTDREYATLIWHCGLRLSGKHDALSRLAEVTEDEILRRQIMERVDYDKKALNRYLEDREGYVYALNIQKPEILPEDNITGYYSDAVLAVEEGKACGYPFEVRKHQIIRAGVPVIPARAYYGDRSHPRLPNHEGVSQASYDQDGNLMYFNSYELPEAEDDAVYEGRSDRFELAYVSMPNPFEAGDQVRLVRKHGNIDEDIGPGTVLSTQDDWKHVDRIARMDGNTGCIDWFDASVKVMFGTDPLLDHDHISPIYLEHYPNTENQKGSVRRMPEC